jgi:hypothetical protein
MLTHIKNFISTDDVNTIKEYIKTIKFNTKEDHVPLHDALFEEYNAPFDLHTRGEMPQYILDIFSKYSKGFYELVQPLETEEYLPPMFSKHYIARYTQGKSVMPQFDPNKPERTYKSLIFWNDDFDGGELQFPGLEKTFRPSPGDLVFFIDEQENRCGITKIENGNLYLSEAWMGHKGQLWMPSFVPYEEVEWDTWEIKGF